MSDAPPPLAQVLPPKHYCNVTFLSIGDVGPDGLPIKRLLCCTRCRETYYCGKVQQRRHWRVHRIVCRPAREEAPEESVAGLSMGTVAESIIRIIRDNLPHGAATTQTLFQSEEMGRPLLFLLKRLQVLRDEERDNAITGTDVSSAMNMMDGLSLLFCKSDASIELLWAIPGVTTFLLNLELSSVTMQKRKLVAAVPSDDELRNSDGDESICFHIFTKTMLRFMEACYVVIKAGLCCRENALASCAARMLMQWYGDPYIRGSFPAGPSESPSVLVFQDPCIRNSFPGGPLESPRVLFSQRLFFACWIFSPMIRWTRRRSSLA